MRIDKYNEFGIDGSINLLKKVLFSKGECSVLNIKSESNPAR